MPVSVVLMLKAKNTFFLYTDADSYMHGAQRLLNLGRSGGAVGGHRSVAVGRGPRGRNNVTRGSERFIIRARGELDGNGKGGRFFVSALPGGLI